jgi:hypothetical protein
MVPKAASIDAKGFGALHALEQELAQLQSSVRNIYEQLGMSQPGQSE